MALYNKHRPVDFDGVVGQSVVIAKLKKMLKTNTLPNVIGLFGPTGTGKTTIARILAQKLGVDPTTGDPNYIEMNCADCRGIDDVREIADSMRYGTLGKAKGRVWVLDEVVQLPTTTQQAMLKMLEDTPSCVYFFLCASSKEKLLATLLGRCLPLDLKPISKEHLSALVLSVAKKETDCGFYPKVLGAVIERAEGSARMALQLLESIMLHSTEAAQLASLEEQEQGILAIDLARAIMYNKGWTVVSDIIKKLSQDPESVRRVVIKYCESVMLGNAPVKIKAKAYFVHCGFQDPESGLVASSWRVCSKQ